MIMGFYYDVGIMFVHYKRSQLKPTINICCTSYGTPNLCIPVISFDPRYESPR